MSKHHTTHPHFDAPTKLMTNKTLTHNATSLEPTTPSTYQDKPLKIVTVSQIHQINRIFTYA